MFRFRSVSFNVDNKSLDSSSAVSFRSTKEALTGRGTFKAKRIVRGTLGVLLLRVPVSPHSTSTLSIVH